MTETLQEEYRQFRQILNRYGLTDLSPQSIANILYQPLQTATDIRRAQGQLTWDIIGVGATDDGSIPNTDAELQAAAATIVWEKRWGAIGTNTANLSPETAMYLANKSPSEALAIAQSKAFEYLAQIYGAEHITPYLLTSNLKDPEQRAETLRLLNFLMNNAPEVGYTGAFQGPGRYGAGTGPADPDPQLLMQIIEDPDSYDSLTPLQKQAVAGQAKEAMASIEEVGTFVQPEGETFDAAAVEGIVAFLTTGKYKLALTQAEKDLVESLSSSDALGQELSPFGGEAAPGELQLPEEYQAIGITSLSGRGEAGTFRMDEEWARANPVKATAIIEKMKARFPGSQVVIGSSGFVGDIFDYAGMPVDFFGGAVGSTLQQPNELLEQWTGSEADRDEAARQAADLKLRLQQGDIPIDQIEDTINKIRELQDAAQVDVGLHEWQNDMQTAITGEASGLGFTPGLLEGFGYMPGDTGYDNVAAVVGLIGNIAFDPLTWLSGISIGGAAARSVPRGVDSLPRISKSIIAQTTYRILAKTPDELVLTRPWQQAIDRLWEARNLAPDAATFETRLMQQLNVDAELAKHISSAQSLEDLRWTVVNGMTGPSYKLGSADTIYARMKQAEGTLDTLANLRTNLKNLKRSLAAQRGARTKLINQGGKEELVGRTVVVDNAGQPLRVYHGSPYSIDIPSVEHSRGGRIGPGAYFTDSPAVAGGRLTEGGQIVPGEGYAFQTSSQLQRATFATKEEATAHLNELYATNQISEQGRGNAVTLENPNGGYDVAWLAAPTPTVSFAYLDIRNPFDLERRFTRAEVENIFRDNPDLLASLGKEGDWFLDGRALYEMIEQFTDDTVEFLKSAGYDGITEFGDQATGALNRNRHWVVWDDSQIHGGPLRVSIKDKDILALEDEVRELGSQVQDLGASELDQIGELAFTRSVYEGRDWNRPISELPSAGELRRLYDPQNLGVSERAWLAAAEKTGQAGSKIFRRLGAKKLMNFLQTKEGRLAEASTQQMFVRLSHWVQDTGAGTQIFFPSTVLTDDIVQAYARKGVTLTEDIVQKSFDNIGNFFKLLGHSDETVTELMTGWSRIGTSKAEAYNWFTASWQRAIDDSPILTSSSKQQLRKVWNETLEERGPGYIGTKNGNITGYDHTLYKLVPDPNNPGSMTPQGTPVFHNDMLQTAWLPTYEQMIEHLSFAKRTLSNMKKNGGAGRKLIANGVGALGAGWAGLNSVWKNMVLLFKMPFSLPLRIFSEEMIRMSAFGYASMVRNPIEWFKSVRSWDEFKLFAESPTGLLGVLERQLTNRGIVHDGKRLYSLSDSDNANFFRAFSGLLGARASVDTRILLKYGDSKQFLRALDKGEITGLPRGWIEHVDDVVENHVKNGGPITSRKAALDRIYSELDEIVGTGGNAYLVRNLLKNGKVTHLEKTYEAGTESLAELLGRWHAEGSWVPKTPRVSSHHADYLPMQAGELRETLRRVSDWMFKYFYSTADLKGARSPLFRQIAAREYQRWTALGYSEKAAAELAKTRAAERTRDLMFEIGASKPAEYTIRSLSPFFPAWKELTSTWLFRVPKYLGGGHWTLGVPVMARKFQYWTQFFQQLGIVRQNEAGDWVVPSPFVKLLNHMFGADFVSEMSAESFAGLLPLPSLREGSDPLEGFLPTLGGPAALVLGKSADATENGVLQELSDTMTFFGADTSLGPGALDRFLESQGYFPPWMTESTRAYHEAQRNWAVIDGMRIYVEQNPPPVMPEDYATNKKAQNKFQKEYQEWADEALAEGERYAEWSYIVRGVAGMTLPASVSWEPKTERARDAIYGLMDKIPGEALKGPMFDQYKAEYPGAWAYMTGTTIDLDPSLGVDPDNFEQFRDEVLDGSERMLLKPDEWLRWSYGMNSYFVYLNQRSQLFKAIGNNPADILTSGYDRQTGLAKIESDWDNFLILTEEMTPDGQRSFADLFEEYEKVRSENTLSIEQAKISEVKQGLSQIALGLSPSRGGEVDFRKMNGILSEAMGDLGFRATTETGKGISWWWKNVGDPYLNEVGEVWDQIGDVEKRYRGPLYEQLRTIENKYYTTYKTGKWGKLPSPQEVFFSNLSPQAQNVRLKEMATLPVSFLNEFYRDKLGYDTADPKKLNELAAYLNMAEQTFDDAIIRSGISYSSKAYEIAKANFEQQKLNKAEELGVLAEYKLWTQPTYKRVDAALDLSNTSMLWMYLVKQADEIWNSIERQGYSPGGSSQVAQMYQKFFVQRVDEYRKLDEDFDVLMGRFEEAYGENGQPLIGADMYMKLFFEYFGDSAPDYIYVR